MKADPFQFLDIGHPYTDFDAAAAAILPVPYEGGVSYGIGASRGPEMVINASRHLELYDEVLEAEPFRMGIATMEPIPPHAEPEAVLDSVYRTCRRLIEANKFVVVVGGDHSVSTGCVQALAEAHPALSVIQIDAHTDLRDNYEGSRYSHACVMARLRELTQNTLQIGIRSMSADEARRIAREELAVCTMTEYRKRSFDLDSALKRLPDPVFITIDVDAFDWSVIRSTGTPEPGGFTWDEAVELLAKVFSCKRVVGFDVVELAAGPDDPNSAFAAAKLIYRSLGLWLADRISRGNLAWPQEPSGSLF